MKFSYFTMIENKYSCRVSLNKPIIIRLDGKGVTKNKSLNIYSDSIGEFAYSLRNTAKDMSILYNTLVIACTDEINVIFLDTNEFYNKFDSCKCQKSSSIISQDVSFFFNNYYNGNRIYFDARTFNVIDSKVLSYLKFRATSAKNVGVTYISKRSFPYRQRQNKKCAELEDMIRKHNPSSLYDTEYFNYGEAYFKGNRVELSKIVQTGNLNLDEYSKKSKKNISSAYCNLSEDELDEFDDI